MSTKNMNILLFIAHADDETLGVGGLIPLLKQKGHHIQIILASDGHIKARKEGINNLNGFEKACKYYHIDDIQYLHLEDQYFDKYTIAEISNKAFSLAKNPDFIITHTDSDLNRDHRIINEAAKIIGRPKSKPISILGMEIANTSSWNGNSFKAQYYVDITETISKKLEAFSFYVNEIREFPYPYSFKGIETLAQYRGMEAGFNYAEAYQIIRLYHNHSGSL